MPLNILLLVADDHRWESLGANGCAEVATPALDALAAAGVGFDGAHCQGGMHPAVCAPSRASLMTGRDVFTSSQDPTGLEFGGRAFAIPAAMPTVPERLRDNGYVTHHVGKWHNDRATFARSFTSASRVMFGGMSDHDRVPLHDYDPTGAYPEDAARTEPGLSSDLFREAAETFLKTRDRDRPFFLQVAFTAPHDPRDPPPRHRIPADRIALPPNFLPVHPFDTGEMLVRDELLERTPRPPDAVRQHIADYLGMVQHLDEAIAGILATLDAEGLSENTLVIYTADHGIAIGQHGLMGKQNLYEHSTRIPLILSGPGLRRGAREPALVWHADTAATMIDAAGLPPLPDGAGESLLPMARAAGARPPRETFVSLHCVTQRAIRDDRWKLILTLPNPDALMRSAASGRTSRGALVEQLFDLKTDPAETVNLSAHPDCQRIRESLIERLLDWQRRTSDPLLADTRAALVRLARPDPEIAR